MRSLLYLVALLSMACSHTADRLRHDSLWMQRATVTVMRLSGYDNPSPRGYGSFHGLDVWEQHQLDDSSRDQLVDFLTRVANREVLEAAESAQTGEIGEGPWGCLSGSRGIRFAVDGHEYDFVVECGLWIQPAPGLRGQRGGPQSTRLQFTRDEARVWHTVFERHFLRGP